MPFWMELRFWVLAALLVVSLAPTAATHRPQLSRAQFDTVLRFVLTAFAFLFYMGFSIGWAPDLELALAKGYELFLLGLALALIARWVLLGDAVHLREAFWRWVLSLTALIGLVSLLGIAGGGELARASVLAGGPNTFGRMMGLLAVACLATWRRRGTTWLWVPMAIVAGFLVVTSGSRGAMLSLIAAVAAFFLIERIQFTRLVALGAAGAAAVFAILSFTTLGAVARELFAIRVVKLSIQDGYTAGRDLVYRDAIELGMANPIAGAGLAGFPAMGLGSYAHNLFLEAFSEGGAIAVVLISILVLSAILHFARNRRLYDGATIAGLALVTVFAQFSGDLYDNRMLFLLLMLALIPRPTEAPSWERSASAPQPAPAAGGSVLMLEPRRSS